MANIISLINLKGGVGKTTLTIFMAEFLAKEYGKRVLVVDLDPQTNATVSLITQDKWKELNENNLTLHQLFLDKIKSTNVFDIKKSIFKNAGNINLRKGSLDLLPSSIELIDISEEIAIKNRDNGIIDIIKNELEKVSNEYDFILIDCPPDLGTITTAGIYASSYYIIPIIADTLSTYGISQIISRISKKTRELKRLDTSYDISPLGIVVNKFTDTISQNRILNILNARADDGELPKVFKNKIKRRDKFGTLAEEIDLEKTMKQKYPKEIFDSIKLLIDEVLGEI